MITNLRNQCKICASLICLAVLSSTAQILGTLQGNEAIAVFINEGRAGIQVNVVSEDKTDKTVLPLHPKQIERTLFKRGQVELYAASEDMVSGRLLFTQRLPTPNTAPEFMEKPTRTFYFRVADGKITLVKPVDLTSKERKWLKEKAKQGW